MPTKETTILGISAYYHDSAAAIVRDGSIVAAAEEERFSRKKHDARFPQNAIRYCLSDANIAIQNLDHIVFYEKPLLKFDRLLETYLSYAPHGFRSFLRAMPVWLKEKLYLREILRREIASIARCEPKELQPILFSEHHRSHAASAFFASPFKQAAVLCMDGVGEWATTSVWMGSDNTLTPHWQIDFPHSLGMLYSAFTYFTGFRVNSGEYKLMGLAPYGQPKYVDLIFDNLVDVKNDGTFRLNMTYFDYPVGLKMTSSRFDSLFGGTARRPESPITQREMDLAKSIQIVTEEIILRLGNTVHRELGAEYLCLAGGVALNCVANGRLLRETRFKDIWIQPAAGDAGGAIGSALSIWHEYLGNPRVTIGADSMKGTYLGPSFPETEIQDYLDTTGAVYVRLDESELLMRVADVLALQNVVGWFQGRMEFGPRALGARSIIADARSPKMQSVMNLKIKRRETFRPFAPAILAERASDYFELDRPSPYMLLVAPVKEKLRATMTEQERLLSGIETLNIARSRIPAVTHVDYSARVQTVHLDTNPRFYRLLDFFNKRAGVPIILNTSFNVRGEPIVCTPADAYRCFMDAEMDYLVLEGFLLAKSDQPKNAINKAAEARMRNRLADTVPHRPAGEEELRKFGVALGAFIIGLFGIIFPWLRGAPHPAYAISLGGGLVACALLWPKTLRFVYPAWMQLALLLNRVTAPIVLGLVFFLLLFPMAFALRMTGRSPMARTFDEEAVTYRVASSRMPISNFRKPF
jgi:carbamoyltransferase